MSYIYKNFCFIILTIASAFVLADKVQFKLTNEPIPGYYDGVLYKKNNECKYFFSI